MNTITLTIAEAARNLSTLVRQGHRTVLVEDGKPVAEIVPIEKAAIAKTGAELAELWARDKRMPLEEAESFARDLEEARRSLNARRQLR